ncbi:MAG: tRNA lysidine(34) synthetase TilS [Congregibacter sp.]
MTHEGIRDAFEECLEDIDAARQVFIAYSGGRDSTVLLHAFSSRFPSKPCIALHLSHGLQADSDAWAVHCASVASALGVDYRTEPLSVVMEGKGLEAAARDARYAAFENVLDAGALLLMGHHQDDQAETLLLRLLRGAGPEGLRAIPKRRALGKGTLLRPFLSLPRATLRDYAEVNRLHWVEDGSNSDKRFDRNFLREEVLPLLESRWPGYRKTLSRMAIQVDELLGQYPAPVLESIASVVGDPGFTLSSLPRSRPAKARAVRGWLQNIGLETPPRARLLEFLRQLEDGEGARLATPGWVLQRFRDGVFVYSPDSAEDAYCAAVQVNEPLHISGVGQLSVVLGHPEAGSGSSVGELILRSRAPGDRMSHSDGRHRSLKNLAQDCAVPPWWRSRMPILCELSDGEEMNSAAGAKILSMGGYVYAPEARARGLRLSWKADTIKAK